MYMFIIDIIFQMCFMSQPQVSQPMANTNVIKKRLRIQKECGQPYDFCRAADYVSQKHSMLNIHHRAMKLRIHN